MTAPAYATDLQDIALATSGETWNEPTGSADGASPSAETDYFIQGADCISKACAINGGGLCGMGTQAASAKTITSPAAVFIWLFFACPNTLDSEANGGMQVIMGNTLANYRRWYVKGKDSYTYGGWVNIAVDPNVGYQATYGAPSGVWQYFGAVMKTLATVAKGSPFGTDAIRFGRELRVTYGDSGGYATFAGAAAKNDANDATSGYNRWGLLQAVDGGFLIKGLFVMGLAATAVDFRDANRNISIQNLTRVASSFCGFEVRNASSRMDWTNINISALGTVSKGFFLVTDNADVNKDACVFTDMDYFTYLAQSTILNSTFRRCGLVTQNSAVVTNCIFENATGAASIVANNPTNITHCRFTSDGSNHAMECTAAGNFDWVGNTLTGYTASSGGNEAFHNSSGGTVNLTILSGDVPSVRNTNGSTTNVIIPEVSLTLSANVTLVGAEIRIYDMDNSPAGSLGTELSGAESHGASTYVYTGSAGNTIWIQIMKSGYVEFGQQFTMPSSNGGLYCNLIQDLNA